MLGHVKSIWTFRHFWLSLVRMDLRTRYRRSVLGLGWSVLNPIMMSAVIVMGFGKILGAEDPLIYGSFLLPGMCTWDFMRNSMSSGCHALIHNESYIRQCPLPYGIYPLRTVAGTGIHFLITLSVTVLICCGLQQSTAPLENIWMLPPTILLLFFFCWGLAAIFAFATAYFHDTHHLTDVAMAFMFFLTPIMIRPERQPDFVIAFNQYNPFNVFLKLIRHPLVDHTMPPMELWLQGLGLTAVVFAVACVVIGALQKKVIFQL
jgi:lipopolysaccharide transport system permease protein